MSNNYTDMRDAIVEAIHEAMPELSEPVTLRDYFAAAAMTGYRCAYGLWAKQYDGKFTEPAQIATWAYADADAMLAERAK